LYEANAKDSEYLCHLDERCTKWKWCSFVRIFVGD
jgi:hypothetical protein